MGNIWGQVMADMVEPSELEQAYSKCTIFLNCAIVCFILFYSNPGYPFFLFLSILHIIFQGCVGDDEFHFDYIAGST